MDCTVTAVRNLLGALGAPLHDIGILSDRGMLPRQAGLSSDMVLSRVAMLKAHNGRGAHIYIRPSGEHRFTVLDDLNIDAARKMSADGYAPCALVETSPGNFQAWLKHDDVYPKQLSTFIARTLAERFGGDPSAADWRRFGRLPGFTNCKPKHRRPDGLFPYVLLRSCTGEQYRMAAYLRIEQTKLFQLREHEQEVRRQRLRRIASFSSTRRRYSHLSLARFRNAPKFHERPAAADIAYCVAAFSLRMPDDQIARTLSDEYLSRDPNPARKAAYIERTMAKARAWAMR